MLTARDLNDPASARVRRYRPQFEHAGVPDPAADQWEDWVRLLDQRAAPGDEPGDAMNIVTDGDFGTVCSSLVALPAFGAPVMKFAAGRPDEVPFERVVL
jgi:hypothetical protein